MGFSFETMGNATLLLRKDGRPVLATDPWLEGTCYFGSWALLHPLSAAQREAVHQAPFIWISHGHPDHLHLPSIETLPRSAKLLIPDHYRSDIRDHLKSLGFTVQVLRFREWTELSDGVRVLCMENENQDAMLVVEVGDQLILNLNDSPLSGQLGFLRRLVKRHRKSYLLMLCTNDADMRNFIDENGDSVAPPPEQNKPGLIWWTAKVCARLGVDVYCPSAFQHIYVRSDSAWAAPYATTWPDLQKWWNEPRVKLCQPFVTVDMESGQVTENHPSQEPDLSQVTEATAEDDWDERLSAAEWETLEAWVNSMPLLVGRLDVMGFVVGGERRHFRIGDTVRKRPRLVEFHVPRRSLMGAVEGGYFDDLLIGNFMKTRCENVGLYPHVSPIVAKLAGTAGVRTREELRRFHWRYFRMAPGAMVVDTVADRWKRGPKQWIRQGLETCGLLGLTKWVRARLGQGPDPRTH